MEFKQRSDSLTSEDEPERATSTTQEQVAQPSQESETAVPQQGKPVDVAAFVLLVVLVIASQPHFLVA